MLTHRNHPGSYPVHLGSGVSDATLPGTVGGMEPETTTEDLVNESPGADDGQPVYGDLEDIEPYAEATEAAEGWSDEKEEGDG